MRAPPTHALRTDLPLLNGDHGTRWGNLGDWSEASASYPEACQALAERLGRAARLGPGDVLLDCGPGAGEELRVWSEAFGVARVVARELLPENLRAARALLERETLRAEVELSPGSATDLGAFSAGTFDAVVALDCAYHFAPRARFFAEAQRVTRPGGRLALTDLVLGGRPRRGGALRALGRWCGIPAENLQHEGAYRTELSAAGWRLERWEPLEERVLGGFARYAEGLFRREALAHPTRGWGKVLATALGCRWACASGRVRYVLIGAVRA